MLTHFFGDISKFFILPHEPLVIAMVLSLFLFASYTDIKENKVYDKMNLFFVGLRLAVIPWYPITGGTFLGGIVGFLLLFLPAFLLGTSNMAGDIKFSAVVGLWLGAVPVLFGLLLATLIFIVATFIKRKGVHGILPYAPFISTGCLLMILLPYFAGWR